MVNQFPTSFLIQKRDDTIYDLGAEGIRVITCDPPSAGFQHTFNQSGKFGAKLTGTTTQQISFPIVFDVFAIDEYDYELQRLKVYKIFDSQEPFYIINSRIPYLRHKVVADGFSYPRLNNYWKAKNVSVNLTAYEGFAETTATTLTPFDLNSDRFGFGIGITNDNFQYSFTNTNKFVFNNLGHIPLLADNKPVEIIFKGIVGKELTIRNNTTKQSFTYKKPLLKSDEFRLIGLVPTVSGSQRLGNSFSSRSYLDFAVGPNEIEVIGARDFTIKFNTRFYY